MRYRPIPALAGAAPLGFTIGTANVRFINFSTGDQLNGPSKSSAYYRLRCVRSTSETAAQSDLAVEWLSSGPTGSVQIRDGCVGASGAWTITSSGGGGSVSGTVATITDMLHQVSNVDLSGLQDRTLTLSFVQTVSGVAGPAVTATILTQIDCADAAALAAAVAGVRCTDGSTYAGSVNGRHLITHVRGCGHEAGGNLASAATADFTPSCTAASDQLTKYWSSSANADEGAERRTDGCVYRELI
jgi:hypothetical protein